jgi:hypothetical protein
MIFEISHNNPSTRRFLSTSKILSLACLFSVFIILITFSKAQSFDVDGFKSEMTKKEVKEQLKEWKFDVIDEKDNDIKAYDNLRKTDSRLYFFNFCDDKLVLIEKNVQPSMKNFIILVEKLTNTYGKPIDTYADTSIHTFGEQHKISIIWKIGRELITLTYNVYPNNDQLYMTYKVSNNCF